MAPLLRSNYVSYCTNTTRTLIGQNSRWQGVKFDVVLVQHTFDITYSHICSAYTLLFYKSHLFFYTAILYGNRD